MDEYNECKRENDNDSIIEIAEKIPDIIMPNSPIKAIKPNNPSRDECQLMNFQKVEPTWLEYDPFEFTQLNISTSGLFKQRQVHIFPNNSTTQNVVVGIRLNSFEKEAGLFTFESTGSTKILTIIEKKVELRFWNREFWHPTKCAITEIDILLPKNLPETAMTAFNLESFDVTVFPNKIPYSQQSLNISVDNGNIDLMNFSAKSISLSTYNGGHIFGIVNSIENFFSAKTQAQDINLTINIAPGAVQPKIELSTVSGDMFLAMNNTFSGNFITQSKNGIVKILNSTYHKAQYNAGTYIGGRTSCLEGSLSITSISGDAEIEFHEGLISLAEITNSSINKVLERNDLQYKKNPLPGPLPLPIIGNLHQMGDPGKLGKKLYAKYGDIFEVYMGSERQIWVSKKDIVDKILAPSAKTNFFNKGAYSDGLNEIGVHSNGILFNRNINSWRFNRKFAVQALTSIPYLKEIHETSQQQFTQVTNYWEKIGSKTPINIVEWLECFTAEIVIKNTANHVVHLLEAYYTKHFPNFSQNTLEISLVKESQKLVDLLCAILGIVTYLMVFPHWVRHYIPGFKQYNDHCLKTKADLDERILKLIAKRRAEIAKLNPDQDRGLDLLSVLATTNTTLDTNQISKSEFERTLTDDEIRAIMIEMFVGATDSTAFSICYIIYYLNKYPHVLEKLRHEIFTILDKDPDSPIPYEKLEKFVYCEAVIFEVNRLITVVPVIPKQSNEADEIGGYNWKAGTVFYMNLQIINENPLLFPDPTKFDPERYLINNEEVPGEFKIDQKKVNMFSHGVHVCPGNTMQD
ncbi:hypothetical protein G9A89_002326 [Geosiphon pyriformis]|nr:hypothetical protein G9A89_002326 [Geosiphon pyriformis]